MRWLGILSLIFLLSAIGRAADWPHRNGPYRNNATTEIVKPWSGPLKPAWHLPLGEGYSSPTVAEGRLFLHAKVKDKNEEELMALDAVTGKQLWRISYPHEAFESNVGNGPRAAPVIALGRVYSFGITGILTCVEAATGKQLWQTNPLATFHAPIMMFGASAYPLVDGNRIYLPVGAPGAAIVCIDAETGKTIWQAYDEPPTSVTPVLFQPKVGEAGRLRHLVYTSTRGFTGIHPADGSTLWEFFLSEKPIGTLPPPTVVGDTLVVSSMLTGTKAIQLAYQDGHVTANELWKNADVTTYFTQNVAVGDQIYAVNATLIPLASIALSCLDAKTGKQLWKKPGIGLYALNMTRTGDDKLLMLDDTHGDLILLDPNPQEYRELARAKVCKPTIITPALANGRLYTRDDEGVNCYVLGENGK